MKEVFFASHYTAITLTLLTCAEGIHIIFEISFISFTSYIVAYASPETASSGNKQPVKTLAVNRTRVHSDN